MISKSKEFVKGLRYECLLFAFFSAVLIERHVREGLDTISMVALALTLLLTCTSGYFWYRDGKEYKV